MLSGDGRGGHRSGQPGTFTVRPEKIHLEMPGAGGPGAARVGDRARPRRRLPRLGYPVPRRRSSRAASSRSSSRTSPRPRWRRWRSRAAAVRLVWERRHTLPVEAGRCGTGAPTERRPHDGGPHRTEQRRRSTWDDVRSRRALARGASLALALGLVAGGAVAQSPSGRAPGARGRADGARRAGGRAQRRGLGRTTSRTAPRARTLDWVTGFEEETGCEVNVDARQHVGRDVHAHADRQLRPRVRVG